MRTIDGKVALITGAAAGIGRALAFELARHGTHLLLVDCDEPRLAETAAAARGRGVYVATYIADLGFDGEVGSVAAWVRDRFGRLDILVNNAGVAYYGTTHEMAEHQWRRVVAVNLAATIQLTHELLPTLFLAPEAHVLNMCSIGGLVGVSRLAVYNATKFALVGFSESLRVEYGPRGLGVTALCPGLVRTGRRAARRWRVSAMTAGRKRPPRFPPWMTIPPERVARRAVRAIRKNRGLVVVSGQAQFVWWVKCLFPRLLDRIQQFRRWRRAPDRLPMIAGQIGPAEDEPARRAA